MEKLKQFPAAQKRLVCILLALICMLGLLPSTAFAAGPNTIVMEDCTHNGVYYESAALSTCWLHQMKFDYNGDTVMGFCADHGGGMGWSLEGHEWNNPREITDPTVKTMLAYFYAHSRGIFTDQAHALGVDEVWSSDYTWTMNAWVQAVVWRYQENLFSDPVAACAEELLYVYNNLEHTNYTSIDDVVDGTTLRDRAQYILDLGAQGVWGDCKVYEYDYAGPGSAQHPAYDVQSIIIGDLTVTRERYQMTVKKVDATNPNLALPGARFLVQNANGTFSQEVVTGSDGTVTLTNLEASTYSVTELDPPDNYQIDNAGPQYVVLPSATGETTATVTFTDTPIRTGEGSIRKVDADDPTKGLAGAVIKIEGVDNEFVGTYITGAGGYLEDVPWDAMPIGSFVASEVTPPNGYTTSNDPDKVRQEFYWDGKHDVDLIFENDAKVKVQLIKLDDSDDPIEGAVFNVVKDGQVVATEATDADGRIIVPNVTEGMYAFFEVSVPAPYAKLQQPVIAHVDQATVDGGGTVTVTAVDQMLPTLTILKRDGQTGEVVPGAVFEITGIHYGYHMDVTTGPDGTATLTGLPVDSYEVTEISVPDPYVVAAEPTQTIWLGPGDDRQLIFDNLKQPELTIAKVDAADSTTPIPGTVFRIEAIDGDYQHDVTTGQDGTVTLRVQPGTYQITELSVPAPYYLPDKDADRVQTITLNAGDDKEVTFKDHKAPELTIYKVDSIAGAPVEGARFHVTYASNGEAADAPATIDYGEIVTDANGEIKLHEQGQRLYPGEFTIEEVEPAPGFQMKEPTRQTVILHGGESKTVRFENTPLNAIIVEKYDSVTGEALAGATFQLRLLGGTSGTGGTIIGQKVTGQNGTAIWTGLTAGTYILEEVDPADGYSIIQSSETVYLADSGEQSVITVRFQNMPDGILLVRKVCATNPSVTLPNAEFKVTYADGTLIGDSNGIFRTDENGEIRIEGLAPGKSVIVTEVSAPPGYIIDTQSQTVQIKEGRTVTLTFKNQPKGELIIQKRDSATKQPLPGAEFRVTTAAGCEVGLDGVIGDSTLTQNGIFTTDSNGEIRITNLAPGAYVISEIRSPSGYVMDAPSTNVVIGEGGDTQTVVITNSKAGSLVIDKRDSLTGEPLEGVTFKVTTSTGEFVPDENGYISSNGIYKTDKDGKIQIDGVVGTLVVTEVETIPGYTIDPAHQTQTVQVNPNDTQTLYFTNTPSTTLVIEKYIEGTTTPLEGVTFLVTDSSGAVVGPSNGEYITDENGRIVIDGLEPGITVTAREVKTLEGYVLDGAPKSIAIKAGEVQTLRFYNSKQGTLVIRKLDSETHEPLAGVEFELTYADGGYVDDANGHLSSKGLYTTNENGEIRISGVTGTIVVKETKTIEGYTIDPASQSQTVVVNPEDTQTLTFYNQPIGGVEILKVDANRTSKRIPNTTFEIRKIDDELIDTVTTDKNGRVFCALENGAYYAVEIEAGEGYRLDDTPHYFEVENGKTTSIRIENEAFSGLLIHKVDSTTGEGIYGAHFLVYDSSKNPIGEYVSDDRGYVYVEGLSSGRYYVRELDNEGYLVDDELKTVYIRDGATTEIEWENTPITAQIQIWKKSADDNAINGFPAGTPLEGAVFEIYNKANALVDTIESNSRGLAVSKPLPLGRYIVKEVSSPQYYSVSEEEVTVYLEHEGQIVQIEFLNESVYTNVSIGKSGYTEVVPGQEIRYTFKDIANNSTVPLDSFYWRDTLPTDAVRLDKIITGTYSARLNYKVVFQTNLSNTQRVLADNLNTLQNYTLDASPAALGLASNEYVTQVTFLFGRVPGGFRQVETPYIYCDVLSDLPHEYRFANKCDVGGMWRNQWIQATDRWVTIIYRGGPVPTLPRTGY
ncbi:Cna protein B-type domain protein [Pseudoflavonifractor capillosus ATCC 29799]|uniref:Cna protein B-type domain protein n=1 Tax=Pseudoflavonifractor capillosus ATCC 29799 TaxID=411467 RepID=A6NYK7_9FIRM|nr:SpaA isopeptide-forming pilin-related protein [Pseudoflavonifractor capillosus]EDM98506.1 Cna protein B-type domain protein [Pseudoflavonifractor capillosus ATCC 29799]